MAFIHSSAMAATSTVTAFIIIVAAIGCLVVAGLSGDDDEVVFQWLPFIQVYRSGRVERLMGTDIVPASFDPVTGVVSKDVTIDSVTGITARLYLPVTAATDKLPVLVYFHGGAFVVESAFSPTFHPHLNNLSFLAPLVGVSVNYRLCPEYPLPIAYEDSWSALRWVFSGTDPWLADFGDFGRVYIAGDSAGANIVQQLAVRAAAEGVTAIERMALVHPFFWGEEPVGCEPRDPGIREKMRGFWQFLMPEMEELDDPRINPVTEGAPSLSALGCQRVLVAVAEKDTLWSRGKLYYEKLKSSGWPGEVRLIDTPGADHDFHIDHPETEMAAAMTKQLAAFFAEF